MIAAGILGLCGNLKQQRNLLIAYVSIVWSLFIVFWAIFGVCLAQKKNLDDELDSFCKNQVASKFTSKLQNAYPTNLATSFCTDNCPCASTKDKFPSAEYTSSVFKATGASNIMDCPKSLYAKDAPADSTIKFLRTLEKKYECSGLCTREKWFYFNDVNIGPPLYPCQESVMDYLSERFARVYGIVLTCAIITFFAPVPAIVLMCAKPRRVNLLF